MLKKNQIEIYFFIIIFLFAIITSSFNTIAWGLLPLLIALYKSNLLNKFTKKDILYSIVIYIIIFCLNFCFVFSFKTHQVKLPHPDFSFYLKVASFFNTTGLENNFTAKNILFSNINFATQYRFFDTWVLSLFIKLIPCSNLIVLQLFYMPFLYFMVAFSIYRNFNWLNNSYLKIFFALSFIFIFGDYFSNKFLFSSQDFGELSVISYPKLSVFFSVFIYFFSILINSKSKKSIIFLCFLPILIQMAFPIYIFIIGYILYYYKYFLKNIKFTLLICASIIYYFVFYFYNIYIFNKIFHFKQVNYVKSVYDFFHRILSITYHLITEKIAIFTLFFIFIFFFTRIKQEKKMLDTFIYSYLIMIPCIVIYALFPNTPNSYQFLSNFIFPVFITLFFILFTKYYSEIKSSLKSFYLIIIFLMVFLSIHFQMNENCFFGSDSVNNKQFVLNAKKMLLPIKNKIGITYWSNKLPLKIKLRMRSESFNQHGTSFLSAINGNYDVVCLSTLDTKGENFNEKMNNYYSAISIFQRQNKLQTNNIKEIFYSKFNFEYLISDLKQNELPDFLKNDIINSLYDDHSKIYCYLLKQKSNN